jgi:hypothetical protein
MREMSEGPAMGARPVAFRGVFMQPSTQSRKPGFVTRPAAWVLAMAALGLASPGGAGDLVVTFTDGATGLPISGAVYAFTTSGSRVAAISGNGTATLTGLAEGSYVLGGHTFSGHNMLLYPATPCSPCTSAPSTSFTTISTAGATPVSVPATGTVTGINFTFNTKGGQISGRTTDSTTGAPIVPTGEVAIVTEVGQWISYAFVNSNGAYTSYVGLPTGTYRLKFRGDSSYMAHLYRNIDCALDRCSLLGGSTIAVTSPSTTSGVDLSLSKGGVVTGAVTSSATNAAISGATVTLYDALGTSVNTVTASSSGVWTTSVALPTGLYYARTSNSLGFVNEIYNNVSSPGTSVSALSLTRSGTPISVSAGATTSGINFALDPGGTISGSVTAAATGLPIGGVTVSIYNRAGAFLASATSGSAGTWAIATGLTPGAYFARTSNALGYVNEIHNNLPSPGTSFSTTAFNDASQIQVIAGSNTVLANFDLDVGGKVSGTVTSAATGLPISGVSVSVYNESGQFVASASTDASGVWSPTTGLTTGTYYAETFNSAGYLDEQYDDKVSIGSTGVTSGTGFTVTAGSTTSGIDFALGVGGSIKGTVRSSATGQPIAGVTVQVFNAGGTSVTSATTGASGSWTTLRGLPTGDYFVRTSNTAGYVDQIYSEVTSLGGSVTEGTAVAVVNGAATSGVDFRLPVGATLLGYVTSSATGRGLANVEVGVFSSAGTFLKSGVSVVGGLWQVDGLTSGSYYAATFSANAGRYIDENYNNIPNPGQRGSVLSGTAIKATAGITTAALDFQLEPGGTLSGAVTASSTGLAVTNATVSIYDADGLFVTNAVTDARGAWVSFGGLPTGSYFARVSGTQGFIPELYNNIPSFSTNAADIKAGSPLTVIAGAATPGINFELDSGASISGAITFYSTGRALQGATVSVYNSAGILLNAVTSNFAGHWTSSIGLKAGTYFARVTNGLGFVNELYKGKAAPNTPSASEIIGSTPITVADGAAVSGVNFALSHGVSIGSAAVLEGHSGSSILSFPVTLSTALAADLSVAYATSAGTATAGADFTTTSGTLVIPAGVTTKNLPIVVTGDQTVEPDETLTMTLTMTLGNGVGTKVLQSTGAGTITNDDPPAAATTVTQYRLYHDGTKEHLYTTDLNEYNVLGTRGWTQEGVAYKMLTNGVFGGVLTVPLFRVYHPGIQQHHWTTDSNEATTLSGTTSWFYEATIGYVLPTQVPGTVALYRMALANPPIHLWTTDKNEYDTLATRGWTPEGIVGYVVP